MKWYKKLTLSDNPLSLFTQMITVDEDDFGDVDTWTKNYFTKNIYSLFTSLVS